MKKLLAILLILSMIFSLSVALTGCEDSSDRRSSSSRRNRDDDDDDERDDDDDRVSAGQDDNFVDAPADDDEPGDSAVTEATEPPTHSGEMNEVAPISVPLEELPIISDDTNLRKSDVEDAYGNEYVGPYFDLCSYGDAYRDGEYITQSVTEFNVNGQYRYFSGTFFTRAKQNEQYTIEFMVYADDTLIFRSEPISRKTKAIDFTIDIGNCDVLRITSRSYEYTSSGTNPGIILVNAHLTNDHDGPLTESAEIDYNLVPLTDLHLYGTDSRAGGDNIDAGYAEDSYGNLYKGIHLELVSWGNGGGDYDKQAYCEFVNNGQYRYLSGTIFARPKQSENYTIEFMVFADDELVYSSGPIDRSTKPIDFVVEIGECDLIRVQTRSTDYTTVNTNPGIFLVNPMVSVEKP